MLINSNTKIARILKENPNALDAIVSIDSRYEKLRNPVLRKLMAARTSIGMAARIGNHDVKEFYEKLMPLGFSISEGDQAPENLEKPKLPAFFNHLTPAQIIDFDVRPIIESGKDPLSDILEQVKRIKEAGALKIINSFEPTPLIALLAKQGFETYTDHVDAETVETWFYKKNNKKINLEEDRSNEADWDSLLKKFENKLQETDVRYLPMPQPMMTILAALETLSPDHALFVHHKRIPVFLLPELRERKFDYRIKELAPGEVQLLIFRE